jgi:hypothetical protein
MYVRLGIPQHARSSQELLFLEFLARIFINVNAKLAKDIVFHGIHCISGSQMERGSDPPDSRQVLIKASRDLGALNRKLGADQAGVRSGAPSYKYLLLRLCGLQ